MEYPGASHIRQQSCQSFTSGGESYITSNTGFDNLLPNNEDNNIEEKDDSTGNPTPEVQKSANIIQTYNNLDKS